MLINKHTAQDFLASPNGQILLRVRAERDWLANHLKVMTSSYRSEECIEEMVAQESEWAGYATLIADFTGNHHWSCCDQVEG